jgi:glutamate--cysteine ligase
MPHDQQVPHLTTALTGPLQFLEKYLLAHQVEIETWIREQWRLTPPPFYSSVDLRNSGFKVAPVDTNLFPAGFNNLNPDFMPLCIQAVQATISEICPSAQQILLIPESHTRNIFYFENLAALQEILLKAGFEVRIGSLLDELKQAKKVSLPSGREIILEPLIRQQNKLSIANTHFEPSLILLNNDLSGEIPPILQNLDQFLMPPLHLGWAQRLKSKHFAHYADVAAAFAERFELDPWLIAPLFRQCGAVNFLTGESETCLVEQTETLLTQIQAKYNEYGITQKPFVVIKADAGTYGMSVMMIQDPEEIKHLNRKQRSQMAAAKGGGEVTKAIIQEGVYTFETWGAEAAVAEPVVYMIGRHVVGGFYRVHSKRGIDENLNAPGADFKPLAFANACNNPSKILESAPLAIPDSLHCTNRFYTYGVIARLALIAAARELAHH